MARRKVITETFMAIKKPAVFGGKQIRKVHTEATSPVLLSYRSCIAGKLAGKKFPDYMAVREAFRAAAKECAARKVKEVLK